MAVLLFEHVCFGEFCEGWIENGDVEEDLVELEAELCAEPCGWYVAEGFVGLVGVPEEAFLRVWVPPYTLVLGFGPDGIPLG